MKKQAILLLLLMVTEVYPTNINFLIKKNNVYYDE